MNQRQQAFCDYYLQTGNATEAAKKAGYSEKTAYSIGTENLKKPEIQKYLESRVKKAHTERIATAEEILEFLSETVRCEDCIRKDRLKAAELLGKRYALFTDSVNVGNEGITVNVTLTDYEGADDDNA